MDRLQPITRNLPPLVSKPLESLLGPQCYRTLVYNVDLSSPECLKLALSKLLGVGIIAGGSIVKVPQILSVLSSKSARGLSLSSYLLDTAATAITVAYNIRNAFPLSTYGEMVFLLAQNAILIVLITKYTPGPTLSRLLPIVATLTFFAYSLSSPTLVPSTLLSTLQTLTIPLSLSSKLPQILSNYRQGSTGQLSTFLVVNSLAGCIARVFTSLTETNDPLLVLGFVAAATLNAVIAGQMWYYSSSTSALKTQGGGKTLNKAIEEKTKVVEQKVNEITTGAQAFIEKGTESVRQGINGLGQPSNVGTSTPQRKVSAAQQGGGTGSRTASPASASSRRYVRKLD